jgi:hypothetical protein
VRIVKKRRYTQSRLLVVDSCRNVREDDLDKSERDERDSRRPLHRDSSRSAFARLERERRMVGGSLSERSYSEGCGDVSSHKCPSIEQQTNHIWKVAGTRLTDGDYDRMNGIISPLAPSFASTIAQYQRTKAGISKTWVSIRSIDTTERVDALTLSRKGLWAEPLAGFSDLSSPPACRRPILGRGQARRHGQARRGRGRRARHGPDRAGSCSATKARMAKHARVHSESSSSSRSAS